MEKANLVPDVSSIENTEESPSHVYIRAKRKRMENTASEDLTEFKGEIRELFKEWASQNNEQMKKLYPILQGIQATNAKIETSIEFLAQQNDDLKKKVDLLEQELKKKDEHIIILEDTIEDMMRGSRNKSLEIKNVPLEPKETKEGLLKMVEHLAQDLKLDINTSHISDIFKSKSNTEKKTVTVEFISQSTRDAVLKSAKIYNHKNKNNKISAKNLGLTKNPDEPIFIAERLTQKASRLYFLARDLKRIKNYKYCWTSFGRVYIRKEDDSPIIMVKSESQIHKLKDN